MLTPVALVQCKEEWRWWGHKSKKEKWTLGRYINIVGRAVSCPLTTKDVGTQHQEQGFTQDKYSLGPTKCGHEPDD